MLYTVYASDDLSHGPEDIFSREETLATLGRGSLELARVGLPVLPALGNHDIIPKNQVTVSITSTLLHCYHADLTAQYPTNASTGPEVWTDYYTSVADIWRAAFPSTSPEVWQQFADNGGHIVR